jgi:hypothetical protein
MDFACSESGGSAMSKRNDAGDNSAATPESPEIEAAAWSAAVDHLFAQSRLSCSINIALVGLVVLALWGHVPHEPLLIWGTLLVGVNVARLQPFPGSRS